MRWKVFSCLLMFASIVAITSNGQQWSMSPEGGVVFSSMPVKHLYKSEVSNGITTGFQIGLQLEYNINKRYSLATGMYLQQTGKKENRSNDAVDLSNEPTTIGTYYHKEFFKLNNLYLPIVFSRKMYCDDFAFSFGLGGFARYVLNGKVYEQKRRLEYFNGEVTYWNIPDRRLKVSKNPVDINRWDVGIIAQIKLCPEKIPIFLKLEGSYGFINTTPKWLIKNSEKKEIMHSVAVAICAGYSFKW